MTSSGRGFLFGGIGLVVVGAALWWLLAGEHHVPRVHEPASDESRERAGPGAEPADAASRATREAEAARLRPTPFRESDEAGAAAAVVVTVLADEKPAAGAACEWAPIDCRQARREEYLSLVEAFALDPDGLRVVTRATSDANGEVRIARAPECAMIRATLGDLAGEAVIDRRATDRAVLRLSRAVRVLVVDEAGAPQRDIPVALQEVYQWGSRDRRRAMTDESGLAGLVPPEFTGGTEPAWRAAIALPLPTPVFAAITGPAPPPSPLRLVLPPTGRLEVKLVGRDGDPWRGPATVFVAAARKRDIDVQPGPEPSHQASRSKAENGVAGPFVVGLGMALEVHARPADRSLRVSQALVDGPKAAGEKVEARVTCGELALVLTGRLVSRDGTRAAGMMLGGRLPETGSAATTTWPANEGRSARTTSDVLGRFSLHFDVDPAVVELKATLTSMRWEAMDATSSRVVRKDVEVALPATARSGSADLGDVIIDQAEEPIPAENLLAAGMVVDDRGGPVGAADLEIFEKTGDHWVGSLELSGYRASTLADGRFTIAGAAQAPSLGLCARKQGWLCLEVVPFERGARDVRIPMTRAGGIEGAFVGLEGLRSGPFTLPLDVYVVGEPAKAGGDGWQNDQGERRVHLEGARFVEETLKPGTGKVEVRIEGEDAAVVTIKDVVVKAGEINRDPRLQIDVRKLLAIRTLTVVDEADGRPIEGAALFTPSLASPVKVETDAKGQALLVTKERSVEVLAVKSGYRSASLPQVTVDATVRLRKTTPVRVTIRLADDVALPEAPLGITVNLEWQCGLDEEKTSSHWADPRNGMRELRFGRDRVAAFLVDDPGVYVAKLSVTKEVTNGRSWAAIDPGDPIAGRVRVEGADVSATVTASPDKIAEATKNLAK